MSIIENGIPEKNSNNFKKLKNLCAVCGCLLPQKLPHLPGLVRRRLGVPDPGGPGTPMPETPSWLRSGWGQAWLWNRVEDGGGGVLAPAA